MVRLKGAGGFHFYEPPYTWEEEQDFYRRVSNGPTTVVHAPAAKKAAKPKRSKPVPSGGRISAGNRDPATRAMNQGARGGYHPFPGLSQN